jgi:CubicO group peptidase (beta-lactamase class C family)
VPASGEGAPAEHGDDGGEVVRQRYAELEARAGRRVDEAEMHRVEGDPRHRDGIVLDAAVDRVAEHRMVQVREVDAHLVRPPGAELRLDQRRGAESLQRLHLRARRSAAGAGRKRRPASAGAGAADAAVDVGLAVEVACHQRVVAAGHRVRLELPLHLLGGGVRARQHHHARGVAVEPVHDVDAAGPAAALRQLDHEAGEHGVLLALDGRVDEQAGRLVDHDHVVVEVEHDDPRALRPRRQAGEPGPVGDERAGPQEVSRIGHHLAVHGGVPDQHLALGAGERGTHDLLQPPRQPDIRSAAIHEPTIASPCRPQSVVGSRPMTTAEAAHDPVFELLRRASAAGLATGWAALASRAGLAGRLWCSGVAALAGAPVTPDLLWDLASLTKPLAGTTLLLLARRDGLDLEMPLGTLLPELEGSPWGLVSVERCATHAAGFPAWAPLYVLGRCGAEGYLEALRRIGPVAAAGSRVAYSDLGFLALGIALERAAGANLAELFAELVAEPLGLAGEVGYVPPASAPAAGGERRPLAEERMLAERAIAGSPPPPLAGVHSCDDGNARGLGGAAASAGLFGTAAAVARLAAEYLPGGGELITAEEAELATRCRTAGLEQARGLGWQLAATPGCSAGSALPESGYGHSGFTGTSVWVDPGERAVYVLLGNRLHPGGRQPDLHPLRRRLHVLAKRSLS